MSEAMHVLALRKRALRQRSALLRGTLAAQVQGELGPLAAWADRLVSGGRWVRRHPYGVAVAVAVGVATLVVWRPVGLARVISKGLGAWQAWQRVQPLLAPLLASLAPVVVASEKASEGATPASASHATGVGPGQA